MWRMPGRRQYGWATTVVTMSFTAVVARGSCSSPSAAGIRLRSSWPRIAAGGAVAAFRVAPATRSAWHSLHARQRRKMHSHHMRSHEITRSICRPGFGSDSYTESPTLPSSSIWSTRSRKQLVRVCVRRRASSSSLEGSKSPAEGLSASGGRSVQTAEAGIVYFVSTPIGNLEDITLRAINILRTADVIAAEDTRTTGSMLKLLGVERQGRLVSHHGHNTRRRVPKIVEAARAGKSVAVVSDAGTPGISDPGMELAAACAAEGVRIVPVPGACAAVTAVSVAGFPSHEFVFFGFVGGKRGSAVRRRKLTEIARESRTCILYEAPHRIADTLRGLLSASDEKDGGECDANGAQNGGGGGRSEIIASAEVELTAGRRPVVLARELTKLHEEIFRGTLADAVARYAGAGGGSTGGGGGSGTETTSGGQKKEPRGEFTVVLGPRALASAEEGGVEGAARAMAGLEARLRELTAGGMSTSSAVKMASKDLNVKKSDVYRVALSLQPPGTEGDG